MQRHWDIFCRVIDNFGDIGICWRLARQLANEHGIMVRLWVDDLRSLKLLCPGVDSTLARQRSDGLEIWQWTESFVVDQVAEVVIEAFACELPPAYIRMMATSSPRPCWINLEYLTAEGWAGDCHGMASPHPSLPLVKYFYFPGFTPASGGLLREAGLLATRDAETARMTSPGTLEVSLFCYETAPVGALLDSLAGSASPVCCYVPPGKPLAAVKFWLGDAAPHQRGNLYIQPIPFLAQDGYDRLLWRCAINFVRGEDSFVRAQWAGKPFVWQAYPQDEGAHLVKMEAFLTQYAAGLDAASSSAVTAMFRAWNTGTGVADAWAGFLARRLQIAEYSAIWSHQLARSSDMASALVKFCASKV